MVQMDALQTPVFKTFALAAMIAAVGAGSLAANDDPSVKLRLALDAEVIPSAIYLTAWRDGDITVNFPTGKVTPLTFRSYATLSDGCKWVGTETLTPITTTSFAYDYTEVILGCDPGPSMYYKTPRSGTVHVVGRQ